MNRFTRNHDVGRAVSGGIIGGIFGGIVLSLLMASLNLAGGGDLWTSFKGAGAPFLAERAYAPGFDSFAILVGLASHFLVSIFWGVLFGLLFFGLERPLTFLLGAVWGVVVWLGMTYVALPILGIGEGPGNVGLAVLLHVIFGLGVAVGFLPFQIPRRLQHAPRVREPVLP